MSIYLFSENDFEIKEGHLCNRHSGPGLTLILFYSPDCPHCKPILTLLNQLSLTLAGCNYGVINVKENRSIPHKSRSTSTPITYVPMCLLYYRGRPIQKFTAQYTLENLQQFLNSASKTIKHNFASEEKKQPKKEIPAFTVGTPFCDEESGVCYLSFDAAYGQTAKAN